MADGERAVKEVELRWTGSGMAFEGGTAGAPPVTIDGDSSLGPSPMDALLLSLAGCMGADVLHILEKSRVTLDDLTVRVRGVRAAENPRRYEEIDLVYEVSGPAPEDRPKVERAVQLSRETYCSVLHSLRPDLDVRIVIEGI